MLSIPSSFAKFTIIDIEPECHINGLVCKTTGCLVSDTSSWRVPVAYQGECRQTPNLSDSEKENIYNTLYNFFNNSRYTESKLGGWVTGLTLEYSENLNKKWEDFVKNKYFPYIQKQVSKEIQKDSPNYQKISILNYAAHIIGYDYHLQK